MKKIVVMLMSGMMACAPATRDEGASDLETLLAPRGFVRVPMERLPTGHFAITASVGSEPLDLIVDTGASHTVLDTERAGRFGLTTEDRGGRAMGVGGASSQSVEIGDLQGVTIGTVRFETLRVSVLDLSQVNRILGRMGNDPVDGIIGGDVLLEREAVIDYGNLSLYFKE